MKTVGGSGAHLAFSPSTWKAEACRSELEASLVLQSEFQDNKGYTKKTKVSDRQKKPNQNRRE